MDGNVKALENFVTEDIETALEMIGALTKCNSTDNVVDKLNRVLATRKILVCWKKTYEEMGGQTVYVIADNYRVLNKFMGGHTGYNVLGKIALAKLLKNLTP